MIRFNEVSTLDKDPVKRVFKRLCRAAKTPFALSLLSAKDDLGLLSLSMSPPCDYLDASSFRIDYFLSSYLSKYKGLQTGIDTVEVALSNFAIAENICKLTNDRLKANKPSIVDPILFRAQQLVNQCLGDFNLLRLQGQERWGPGASTDLPRRHAYLDSKIAEFPIDCSIGAMLPLKAVIEADLHWSAVVLGVMPDGPFSLLKDCFHIIPGSRIDTVEKNAKTARTIGIEPRGNMFLQKSVGRLIRRRLKRFGVDLDNQGHNQDLARDALGLELATIDLKMASDTMSTELIYSLLPFPWASYLDQIRSKNFTLRNKVSKFEKFSSMGNGFTFELESLLFWALTKASMSDESLPFAVYGDDIICPMADSAVVISTLSFCGFTTNVDKTFVDGPFRESCGRHYFNSVDVTPVYQKDVIEFSLDHVRFLNRLLRYAAKHNDGDRLEPFCYKPWRHEYDALKGWRPHLPLGSEGDDGYLVPHSLFGVTLNRNLGYRCQVFVNVRARIPSREPADLAYALRLAHLRDSVSVLDMLQNPGKDSTKPYDGYVDSRDDDECLLTKGQRWVHPSWEFALDTV